MPKIQIDDFSAKRLSAFLTNVLFGYVKKPRYGYTPVNEKMDMSLYVETWRTFATNIDDWFCRKSSIEILIIESRDTKKYESLIEIPREDDTCKVEYLLAGGFLQGCLSKRVFDNDAIKGLEIDVANRFYTLLKRNEFTLLRVVDEPST